MSEASDSALAGTGLFVEERQAKILEFIEEHRKATVAQLCQHFGVSSATIRNDLRDLENRRLILRTHGGAMVKTKTGFELDSFQKQVQNLEAKKRIAQAALRQVEDGDTVILDTGTTTLELARLLDRRRELTVVTNDLAIAALLEDFDGVGVVFVGGLLRKRFHCTVSYGNAWRQTLSGLTVDKAFMGVNSLSLEKGAMTPDLGTAETKKLMIEIAVKVILLCDSSKLGRSSFARFATMDQIDAVVTERAGERERRQLEELGVELIVAGGG
jgi:DeoR family fructose operon transcriptional repressor